MSGDLRTMSCWTAKRAAARHRSKDSAAPFSVHRTSCCNQLDVRAGRSNTRRWTVARGTANILLYTVLLYCILHCLCVSTHGWPGMDVIWCRCPSHRCSRPSGRLPEACRCWTWWCRFYRILKMLISLLMASHRTDGQSHLLVTCRSLRRFSFLLVIYFVILITISWNIKYELCWCPLFTG